MSNLINQGISSVSVSGTVLGGGKNLTTNLTATPNFSGGAGAGAGAGAGGSKGSSYDYHRQQKGKVEVQGDRKYPASMNLHGKGEIAVKRRDEWINEVKAIQKEKGISYKEALAIASELRKKKAESSGKKYLAVRERRLKRPDGSFDRTTGICTDPKNCVALGRKVDPSRSFIGNYQREGGSYAKRSHRRLTLNAATELLRNYYRDRISKGMDIKTANANLIRSVSRKHSSVDPVPPCPTKTITLKNGKTRKIAVVTPECKDNWLYRTANPNVKYRDMIGLDHGESKKSPALKTLLKAPHTQSHAKKSDT